MIFLDCFLLQFEAASPRKCLCSSGPSAGDGPGRPHQPHSTCSRPSLSGTAPARPPPTMVTADAHPWPTGWAQRVAAEFSKCHLESTERVPPKGPCACQSQAHVPKTLPFESWNDDPRRPDRSGVCCGPVVFGTRLISATLCPCSGIQQDSCCGLGGCSQAKARRGCLPARGGGLPGPSGGFRSGQPGSHAQQPIDFG